MQQFTLKDNTSLVYTYDGKAYQLNVNIHEGLLTLYRLKQDKNNPYNYKEELINIFNMCESNKIMEGSLLHKMLEEKKEKEEGKGKEK